MDFYTQWIFTDFYLLQRDKFMSKINCVVSERLLN